VAYSSVILGTAGLVSYWRLGEASGNALDSKDSNPATTVAGITRNVTGLLVGDANGAAQGDGVTGHYMQVPSNANMDTGAQVTVEAWIKPTSTAACRLISRSAASTNWFLELTTGAGYRWYVRDTNIVDTSIQTQSAPYIAAIGTRHHLVGVYDAAGTIKFYVNGTAAPDTPNRTPNANLRSGTGQEIAFFAESSSASAFNGVIDEVALYNTALTAQQVLDHYNAGLGAAINSDSPVGPMALSGSRTESFSGPTRYTDARSGAVALSGSVTESQVIIGIGWGRGVVRELPPLRHYVDAIALSGRHYRWANDEPDAQNVPNGLRWGSTMPGGYETMDCVLPRKPGYAYADLERLSTLRVIRAGGTVVGEYRLERMPQTSGDQMSISPSAVGWQAHLDDNKNVNIVFIDRELGGWVGANGLRRVAETDSSSQDPIDPSSTQGEDGLPSLKLGTDGAWARRWNCEAYYHFPASDAGSRVRFDYQATASIGLADPNWVADAYAVTADGYSTFTQLTPTDWLAASTGSVDASAAAIAFASRRALMLRLYYAGAFGADKTTYEVYLRNLRVFGDHGLTIQGATAAKEGFLASDMIAYAVRRWAPMLTVGSAPSFMPTDFVIPQAVFKDATVTNIVTQTTRFGLEDWAVWNDKMLYLNQRNGSLFSKKWRARIGPARLEETGKQMDRLWESIIVQFNDVDTDRSERTVGPPGSGADVESAFLKDSDPDNPANKIGLTRRDKLVMGTSTYEAAIQAGQYFLQAQKLIDRSGRATLVGHVEDNHGVLYPYSEVRAGDAITFIDASDTSYRRIVKADCDDATKSTSVDLDAPPEGLQAVLERIGADLVPLGVS
jgi:hypothetical protein